MRKPDEVVLATQAYRSEMDTMGAFIEETCIVDRQAEVPVKESMIAYKAWCTQHNEYVMSPKAVAQDLEARGYKSGRLGGSGARTRVGARAQRRVARPRRGAQGKRGALWPAMTDVTDDVTDSPK